MEQRTITILDTATSRNVNVVTNATTLGELKSAVRAAGINVEDKDWMEGISGVKLINDDSQLPTNVKHRKTGVITNNLVFMLTNSNNKIKSGSRKEIYEKIKEYDLAPIVKREYGRNYTQVPTDVLEDYVRIHERSLMKTAVEEEGICDDCEYKSRYIGLLNGLQELLIKYSCNVDFENDELREMFNV